MNWAWGVVIDIFYHFGVLLLPHNKQFVLNRSTEHELNEFTFQLLCV